jgi:hypothetical protein
MNPRDKEILTYVLVVGCIVVVFEVCRFIQNLNNGLELMAEEMVAKIESYVNQEGDPDA